MTIGGAGTKTGVVIVGHGSRDGRSNSEFESLVSEYRTRRPDLDIRHSYTELARPDTKTVLADFAVTHERIVIVPLFLYASGHIKNDLPLIVTELKRVHREHDIRIAHPFGVHPKLIEIMFERVRRKTIQTREEQRTTGVIVVNRGSSDVDANGDFHKTVRLFEEGNEYAFVLPSFIGITQPLLGRSLEMAAKLRPEKLLVLPYFLFGGRLIRKIETIVGSFSEQYPWIKTELAPYFGEDPNLFSLLDEKVDDALAGRGLLPCLTCEYRQQLPGLSNKVGGLRALLWSLRHMETHNQAVPHEFPHKNLRKHVFVCTNADCADRGSLGLLSTLRALIRESGRQRDFKVTRTSCMGRCGEGPTVVVYPDGVWYQRVQESDAHDLVHDHLFNDRLLPARIDNIMQ